MAITIAQLNVLGPIYLKLRQRRLAKQQKIFINALDKLIIRAYSSTRNTLYVYIPYADMWENADDEYLMHEYEKAGWEVCYWALPFRFGYAEHSGKIILKKPED